MAVSKISISTDVSKLDVTLIYEFLTHSYWAQGRTKEEVLKSIKHSLNFGVYLENGQQIGFARILTDYTVFGYLMDVFILEAYRGKGYSKELLSAIFAHRELQDVQRWMLGTKDAHELYKQFGFETIKDVSKLMGKRRIESI